MDLRASRASPPPPLHLHSLVLFGEWIGETLVLCICDFILMALGGDCNCGFLITLCDFCNLDSCRFVDW